MYSHLPQSINPIAFSMGPFSIRWYAIMYLVGFFLVYFLLRYRIKKGEGEYSKKNIEDFLLYAFAGLLIGGRLGYVLLYSPFYFWEHPLAVLSPLDLETGEFIGIFGMSYFGGLFGAGIASWIFSRRNKLSFISLADFVVPAVPAGYFFGRLGNFLNGELYGKITSKPWGMYFDGSLRHPTQLYEACAEGIGLFFLLWTLRNSEKMKGIFLPLYLVGYGTARFIIEFFRVPEKNDGFSLTYISLGQLLSLVLIVVGLAWSLRRWRKSAVAQVLL